MVIIFYNVEKEVRKDDYDWNTMSDYYRVNIDISCLDFEKSIPIPRTVFNK